MSMGFFVQRPFSKTNLHPTHPRTARSSAGILAGFSCSSTGFAGAVLIRPSRRTPRLTSPVWYHGYRVGLMERPLRHRGTPGGIGPKLDFHREGQTVSEFKG